MWGGGGGGEGWGVGLCDTGWDGTGRDGQSQ